MDLDEAYNVITKLEEARIILNKLMGPNGVITERERSKFLKSNGSIDDNHSAMATNQTHHNHHHHHNNHH